MRWRRCCGRQRSGGVEDERDVVRVQVVSIRNACAGCQPGAAEGGPRTPAQLHVGAVDVRAIDAPRAARRREAILIEALGIAAEETANADMSNSRHIRPIE